MGVQRMSLSLFPIRPRPADSALERHLASSRDTLSILCASMVLNMDQQSLRGEHMEPVVRHCLLVQPESRKCVVGENECVVSVHIEGMGAMENHTLEPYAEKFGRPDVPLSRI